MYTLVLTEPDLWNEETSEFVIGKQHVFKLEHSLISMSLWETEYERSFYYDPPKTVPEMISYIRCMTIKPEFKDEYVKYITIQNINDVNTYIGRKMSASKPRKEEGPKRYGKPRKDYITTEQIYSWMVAYRIPFETAKWPFNRLWNLIQFCQGQNKKPRKYSAKERDAIIRANRAKLGTKG